MWFDGQQSEPYLLDRRLNELIVMRALDVPGHEKAPTRV
jgi:hypothetical protein